MLSQKGMPLAMSTTCKNLEPASTNEQKHITYNVDKMTFVVKPVYNKGSSRTIHEILLDLMVREVEQTA